MPKINLKQHEIRATKHFENPDWRVFRVKDISTDWEKSKNTGTNVMYASFICEAPPDDKGVPVDMVFSEKALGKAFDKLVPFLQAFLAPGEVLKEGEIDTDKTKGKLFEGWSNYDGDGDYPGNKITDFRPYRQTTGKTA